MNIEAATTTENNLTYIVVICMHAVKAYLDQFFALRLFAHPEDCLIVGDTQRGISYPGTADWVKHAVGCSGRLQENNAICNPGGMQRSLVI